MITPFLQSEKLKFTGKIYHIASKIHLNPKFNEKLNILDNNRYGCHKNYRKLKAANPHFLYRKLFHKHFKKKYPDLDDATICKKIVVAINSLDVNVKEFMTAFVKRNNEIARERFLEAVNNNKLDIYQ